MNNVTVQIAGRTYPLCSDGNAADVERAAAMVDLRLEAVAKAMPQANLEKVAVLALVHMADELIQTQNKMRQFDTFLDAQTRQIEAVVVE